MRVISRKCLLEYAQRCPETDQPLRAWFTEVRKAQWQTPPDVKQQYGTASILKQGRAVFNICGNKHRLVVRINYPAQIVYIRFIGTHKEYDEIDAETV